MVERAATDASAEWTRVLPFDAIVNFRDFGGYATGAGGRVITGRLFRAAHQNAATDADLARMQALGIGLVVDLRRPTERRNMPSRRPLNWAGVVIDNDLGDEAEPPHLAFLRRQAEVTPESVETYLQGYYRKALHEERHQDLFRRAFTQLRDLDGGVLVHCAAGKDRTGLLVALIHSALGVHNDDIVADYILTNALTMTPARVAQVHQTLTQEIGRSVPDAAVQAFLGVTGEHLDIALATAREKHGSVENYLRHLGVSREDQDVLVARYTA